MTKDEAMQIALDALTYIHSDISSLEEELIEEAIEALRTALTQPNLEPVAWGVYCDDQFNLNIFQVKAIADFEKIRLELEYPDHKRTVVPLYIAPPQRKPDIQLGITYKEANPPQRHCERCGKKLGTEVTDIHTCTPKKLINVNGVLEQAGYTKKKEWVGLTDKEIAHIEDMTLDKGDAIRLTAVALMEKNSD